MLRNAVNLLILFIFISGCGANQHSCQLPPDILKDVSKMRNLPPLAEVPCVQTGSEAELREILSETIDKRLSREQVELEGKIMKLLGIIPRNYNYREKIISQYASRLSGFYSPEFKRFVLAKDLGAGKKGILAHEYTHALQDQYYDLNTLTSVTVPSDTILARTSIFEGDANIIMHRFTTETYCQEGSVAQSIEQLEYLRTEKSEIPLFFELQMAFPYLIGEQFICQKVAESRKEVGGSLSKTLSVIYKSLPHSSSQLLGLTDTTDLEGEDCLKSDSYGLFGIVSLLAPEQKLKSSIDVLKSLVGDRICLNQTANNEFKLEWRIRVRSDNERIRLKEMLADYFSKHLQYETYFITGEKDEIDISISDKPGVR